MIEINLESSEEEKIHRITKALSTPTRYRILTILSKDEMDISQLAQALELTEANISAQVKHLEKADLLDCRYKPGEHGVRKICRTKVSTITISLADQDSQINAIVLD